MSQNKRNFLQIIRENYGETTQHHLSSWMTLAKQYYKTASHVDFLIECRRHDILPKHLEQLHASFKHIDLQSKWATNKLKRIINSLKKSILNIEIKDQHFHLALIRRRLNSIESELECILPTEILQTFYDTQQIKLSKFYFDHVSQKQKKMSNLVKVNDNVDFDFTDLTNTWFKNLTEIDIPRDVIEVASLGNKFNFTKPNIQKNDIINVVKNVENSLYNFDPQTQNKIRHIITDSISTQQKANKKMKHINKFEKDLTEKLERTSTFLNENNDIFFTPADKGNVTVALKRNDYIQKVELLLSDEDTYKIFKNNPLPKVINQLKDICNRWKTKKYISYQCFKRIFLTSANLARAYALPKIHKQGNPFRLIVSAIGSPLYHFSKLMQIILSKTLDSEPSFSLKNSNQFHCSINNFVVPQDHCLISLDVTALFTNIPNELVIEGIKKRWPTIAKFTDVPISEMITAINLILNSTFFTFNEKTYQQVDGSPMGSPVSPPFSEIVLRDLENECLKKLPFKVHKYYRYVDDVFCIVPKDQIDTILDVFNNYHPRLSFTHEIEVDGKISFLDLNIIRSEKNKIFTNWYRKPTYSGRVLHFKSHHPTHQKRAMVFGLVDKAISLSHPSFHTENIKIIKNILLNNKYPMSFINKYTSQRIKMLKNRTNPSPAPSPPSPSTIPSPTTTSPSDKKFIVAPFHTSLNKKLTSSLKHLGINVINKISNKLNTIVKKGKDKLPKTRNHEVIYKINCNDCDKSYIGQTYRALEIRVKEHQNNIRQSRDKYNVISEHRTNTGHDMKWDNYQILDRDAHWYRRNISEMLHIKSTNNTLNRQIDTEKLNKIYDKILYSK